MVSMALRTLLFLAVVLLVLGGACAYMAERSMALCPALAVHPGVVRGVMVLFAVLLFALPALHRVPGLARAVDPMFGLSYGLFSFLSTYLPYLAAADLLQSLAGLFGLPLRAWAVPAAGTAALVSALLGLATALRPPEVRRVEVPIPDLPEDLDGFRIVQISDLHLGPLVRRTWVDRLVAAGNALHPDLVAVTGDLADGEAEAVRAKAEPMGALRAAHGIFFVTGNHEYYSGVARWLAVVRDLGWRALHNEHALVQHGRARLAVAGMPDPTARGHPGAGDGPDLAKALAGIPGDALPILLFHPPLGTEAAERAGVRLQLSGHTHAGQYFPWSPLVQRLYVHPKGLGRQGRLWIHTSVGTGFWGPPNRFLVPAELTLLVLKRG